MSETRFFSFPKGRIRMTDRKKGRRRMTKGLKRNEERGW